MLHKVALTLSFIFYAALTQAEPLRLLAFGDSLVHGYGLPQDEGFVPQLESRLRKEGYAVDVINGGVSGDTTAGGLARIEWTLAENFDAILIALGGNDALRGLSPSEAKANLKRIINTAQSKDLAVLLVGIQVPGNFGTAYQDAFSQIYTDLAAEHDVLLYPNMFIGISDAVSSGTALHELMQDDGIHPNAFGVAVNIEGLVPQILGLFGSF